MNVYIALLRAVNVGGTGKLPMSDLVAICIEAGFTRVRTYIASGNVVFESALPAREVKAQLEARLLAYAGKPVGVLIRTAAELAAVLRANPFPEAAPNRVIAIFLDSPAPSDALDRATGLNGERMRIGACEIFVNYTDGMGTSKLKIPAAKRGTARNMNTIGKLVKMAAA